MSEKKYIDKKDVLNLLSAFSGQQNILVIQKEYVQICEGNYEAAAFLSQLIYWSDKSRSNEGWVFKTYSQWEEELMIKERTLRRIKDILVSKGFIEMKTMKINGVPVCHWRATVKILEALLNFYTKEDESDDTSESGQDCPSENGQDCPSENEQDCPSGNGQTVRMEADKLSEWKRTNCPNGNGQIVRMETDKLSETMEADKLSGSINTKTTKEYITSNTPPPENITCKDIKQGDELKNNTQEQIKNIAKDVYEVFVSLGMNSRDSFEAFYNYDFRVGIKKLQAIGIPVNTKIVTACKNYTQVLALKKQNNTWWNYICGFGDFCNENIFYRFLPERFNLNAFKNNTRSPPFTQNDFSKQDFSYDSVPEHLRPDKSCLSDFDAEGILEGIIF